MKRPYCLWYIDEAIDKIRKVKKACHKPAINISVDFQKSVMGRFSEDDKKEEYIDDLRSYIKNVREILKRKPDFEDISSSFCEKLEEGGQSFSLFGKGDAVNFVEKTGRLLSEKAFSLKPFLSLFYPADYFLFLEHYIKKEVPLIASESIKETMGLLSIFDEIYRRNLDSYLIKLFKDSVEATKLNGIKDMGHFYKQKECSKLFVPRRKEQEEFLDYFESKMIFCREKELAGILSFCSEIENYFNHEDKSYLENGKELLYEIYYHSISFQILKDKFYHYGEVPEEVIKSVSLNMACPLMKDVTSLDKLRDARNKVSILSLVPFFSVLEEKILERLRHRVKMRRHGENDILFYEGDRAEELYIIKSGRVSIFKEQDDFIDEYVSLSKGDMFGEMGIMGDAPRTFSARVSSDKAEIYVIGKDDFFFMLHKYAELGLNLSKILCKRIDDTNKRLLRYLEDYFVYIKEKPFESKKKADIVGEVPLFAGLSSQELKSISSRMKVEKITGPAFLFEEGDPSDCLYIIKSGEVEIYKVLEDGEDTRDFVTLKKGDNFGEMGVIGDIPRSLSAEVSSFKAELYVISKEDFLYIMRKYPQIGFNLSEILCNRIDDTNKRLLRFM